MMDMIEIAIQFGQSLDRDEFHLTQQLLSEHCEYTIGEDTLIGPESICQSYEQNMIAGRKKLDVLEWGQSVFETISDNEFYVHFTDYLTHKEKSYTHRCKQKLTLNENGKITHIEHIHDQEEQDRLDHFYREVGLKE